MDNYCLEIENRNYEQAYNIANSELTKYLVYVKRHTVPMLSKNEPMALPLLKIDIDALDELFNRVMFLMKKINIDFDVITKINFVSSLCETKAWKDRMKSFVLIYYYITKPDEDKLKIAVDEINIDDIDDTEVIKLILDIKSGELEISKKTILFEKIIATEKDDIIKAKYQFQKAINLFLNNDREIALEIAQKAIDVVDNAVIKETYHCHISAQMFSMFAQITSDNEYYYKAIIMHLKIMKDNDFTNAGKARNSIALGHTYYLLGDYENAEKYLLESNEHEELSLANIYLASVKIAKEDFEAVKQILSTIAFEDLPEHEKFDYLIASSVYVFKTKDIAEIEVTCNRLKNIRFNNTHYFSNLQLQLLLELKDASFKDAIKNEIVRNEWLDKLSKFIVLQPNFLGIGININNIIDKLNTKKL